MLETTVTKLSNNLLNEVRPCFESQERLHVKQDDGKEFVIISTDDWRAIEETLFLNQIPVMVASIHEAASEPLTQSICLEDLNW